MITSQKRTVPVQNQSKAFITYIHSFRGIAILFVVACHLLLNWSPNSKVYKILELLFGNGTVLFVFIAGYLFQHLTKKLNYTDYLKKKFLNVILPYFIISAPIIAYRIFTGDIPGYITNKHADFFEWHQWQQVAYYIFYGAHMQPLWFIPMISIFYLFAPLFFFIDQRPIWYYLLIPLTIISIFIEREPFSDILKMFVHFISVYTFGMFMSRYKEQFLDFAKKKISIINLLLCVVLLCNYFLAEPYHNAANYIQKMLFCPFFIYWLWKFDKYIPRIISSLAEISFGVFFLHYYFILIIKAVYEKFIGVGIPGNFLYWGIDYLLVLVCTFILIKLVKFIFPKYSRYLIGC